MSTEDAQQQLMTEMMLSYQRLIECVKEHCTDQQYQEVMKYVDEYIQATVAAITVRG